MSDPDFHIWEQANKVVAWFLIGLTGLLGVVFTWAGAVGLLKRVSADDAVLLVLGIGFLFLSIRFARFYLLPRLSILSDRMIVRPFLGRAKSLPFGDVASWKTEVLRIEKNWRGRRLPVPLNVERLTKTDRSGGEATLILPGYAGRNEKVISAMEARSGVAVTRSN